MSWYEYNDMWDKAQKDGKYHLYIFDMKDSKTAGYYYAKVDLLLYRVYFKIKDLEKERGQILHTNEKFNIGGINADMKDPFFLAGDFLGFTTIRGTIEPDEVYKIFREAKIELNIPYMFHYDNGYYETDGYENDLYYRGYCMAYLEDRSKKKADLI